jgi:enamine deaminase RidA (YjgF/YER057c/UK114 family)
MGTLEQRLNELGIDLPAPAAPAGAYVPTGQSGTMLFVSGQLPLLNGELRYLGHLGDTVTIEEGYAAARLCGLNLLAQVKAACGGDLDRVSRVLRLGGFVASTPAFDQQPKVINGASDLMTEVFGDKGRHARFAVGASALPLGVAVEVEGVFEVADGS